MQYQEMTQKYKYTLHEKKQKEAHSVSSIDCERCTYIMLYVTFISSKPKSCRTSEELPKPRKQQHNEQKKSNQNMHVQ